MPYEDYLRSEAWKRRREYMLRRAGYRCRLCNRGERLEVHHRTYERLGAEDPDDLTVLCHDCHLRYHNTPSILPVVAVKKGLLITAQTLVVLIAAVLCVGCLYFGLVVGTNLVRKWEENSLGVNLIGVAVVVPAMGFGGYLLFQLGLFLATVLGWRSEAQHANERDSSGK